jgi:hypothetical protein
MSRVINWFGLAAGIVTLVLLVLSLYLPWWQLTVGNNFIDIYASPINWSFGLYGSQFTIPLIWAWNLSNILLFTAGGIIMLAYSFVPTKPYAQDLLSFAYKKPLYALVSFVVGLVVIVFAAGFLGANFPLWGSANLTFTLPSFIPLSASISSVVTATFLLPFYFGIVAVVLCIAARLYHGRLNKPEKSAT